MYLSRARAALAAGGALVVVALTGIGAAPAQAAPTSTTIQVLGINDFHGRLESTGKDSSGQDVGGAAQLAGMVAQFRKQNPNTVFVGAGDLVGASAFISAVQQDQPTIDAFNLMGLDASAVGNHEFDHGYADVTDRIQKQAKYTYLGANVYQDGQPALPPSKLMTVDGVKVGLVGVVTQETATLVSPDGIRGIEFRDPTTEANKAAAQLREDGAQLVVMMVHEGSPETGEDTTTCAAIADQGTVFGKIINGASKDIDAIVSGHTHEAYNCSYPVAGLDHPRPVVQTGFYGSGLDQLLVTVTDGKVTEIKATVVPVVGFTPDEDVAKLVADAKAKANEVGNVKVGEITADIKRAFLADGTTEDRGSESVLGNFIADVQLDQTAAAGRGGAQIALMNPGGLRADLLKGTDGTVTYAAAATVQPFANDLVTKTYTGAEIKAALEQQWQPAGASRPILHLGVSKGFHYEVDANATTGNHIGNITLNGQPVDPTTKYRVTVNSFLAAGGDNFTALGGGTDRFATGDNDLTALVNYFGQHSPVTADTASRWSPKGTGGTGGSDSLPITGENVAEPVGVGLTLVLVGAGLLWSTRRRRPTRHAG